MDEDIEQKTESTEEKENDGGGGCVLLFFMVGVIGLIGYGTYTDAKVDIEKARARPVLQERDVIGSEIPDKFYEINGRRAYIEVDGRPAEEYFKR